MNSKALAGLVVIAGMLGACALKPPEELIGAAVPTVGLELNAAGTRLSVTTPAQDACVKEGLNVNGCFEVGKNRVAFVRFNLQAPDGWQFQHMKICLGETQQNENCNLTPWNRLEFIAATARDSEYVLANAEGIMDLRILGPDLQSFMLATQNLYEQWWYYQIQICPAGTPPDNDPDDPNCLWNVDPPMKNRGRRTL